MGRLLTVVVALLGLAATVWNTISVEKKSEVLEESDSVVSAMRTDLESREMNYRLAVQEFNFSTLHAATAYDIDRNERILGASVAPGATILHQQDAGAGPAGRLSLRDKAKQRVDLHRRSIDATVRKAPAARDGGAPEGPGPGPAPAPGRKAFLARQSIFARVAGPAPKGPPGAPPPPPESRRVVNAISDAAKSVRGAIRPAVTDEKRQQLVTIRGFQIENLSRWRQYMNVASTGEAMSRDEVAGWEGLLADALIEGQDPALDRFAADCAQSVEDWESSYADGRVAVEEESGNKAGLQKEVDRGKSIYMGLMLLGLVMVTIKDVFAGEKA